MSDPVISVVVVSDYAGGTPGTVDDYRHSLAALAAQDFAEPFEVIVSEWEGFREAVPADIGAMLPSMRMVYSDERSDCHDLHGARELDRARVTSPSPTPPRWRRRPDLLGRPAAEPHSCP